MPSWVVVEAVRTRWTALVMSGYGEFSCISIRYGYKTGYVCSRWNLPECADHIFLLLPSPEAGPVSECSGDPSEYSVGNENSRGETDKSRAVFKLRLTRGK